MLFFPYSSIKALIFKSVFLSKLFTNLRNKFWFWIYFSILYLFHSPFLFSNPYRESSVEDSVWTCEIDSECLRNLQSDFDKHSEHSLYGVCQYEYEAIKSCCESLNNCPSRYGADRDLESIKSNFLNSLEANTSGCSAGNMSGLIGSIHGLQKEVCHLGAENCKKRCESKLNEVKRRIKRCFSIDVSLDKALKQARSSQDNFSCYSEFKKVAEKYKLGSLSKRSELREDLSVEDIELEMRLMRKDGRHRKIPNSLSPFSVGFDINKSYSAKTFEVSMVNPETKELVLSGTFSIKPKKKKQRKQEKQKKKKKGEKRETDVADLTVLIKKDNIVL